MNAEDPQSSEEDVDASKILLNRLRDLAEERGEQRYNARAVATARAKAQGKKQERKESISQRKKKAEEDSYFGRDPQGLSRVFSRLVSQRGWNRPIAVGGVLSRWRELVGSDIADHCIAESFENSTIQVRCDSTVWASNLRLMAPQLVATLNQRLGDGVVTKLEIRGPAAPSWKKGPRSVQGRGPRDTYG